MRIGFIGGGTMAEAMIDGILGQSLTTPKDILVAEPLDARQGHLAKRFGVSTSVDNLSVADNIDLVILAIKPQNLPEVCRILEGRLKPKQTVISIIAGAKMSTLSEGLHHSSIIRVMPNAPAQIGAGMSVWTSSPQVPQNDIEKTRSILRTLGEEIYVSDEKYIDMATALSGSGPAYVFLFVEALIDAGVYMGMPREMARTLALQTVLGSALLAKKSGKHPAELKDMIASPGGTTVEGLLTLESRGFREAVIKAVVTAYEKAKAIGAK